MPASNPEILGTNDEEVLIMLLGPELSTTENQLRPLTFHLWSIWLFTLSDLKTIVGPSTAFAVSHGCILQSDLPNQLTWTLLRSVPAAFWAWINLLPFAINNQRKTDAIKEDCLNKPWRSMPAKRMSQAQATKLMWALYPVAVATSAYLGALRQSLLLVILGAWYNDFGGADASCLVRNFINACGFVCFTSGALQVAVQLDPFANAFLSRWFITIGAVVFSTIHTQDIYDQNGDSARGRMTVPLVAGDRTARWTIALSMSFWCLFCPWIWDSLISGYIAPVSLGSVVVFRTLKGRDDKYDKNTFRLWNAWLVSLFCLPWIKSLTIEH